MHNSPLELLGQIKFAFLEAEVVNKAAESGYSAGEFVFPPVKCCVVTSEMETPLKSCVPVPFPTFSLLADCVIISFTKSSINFTVFFL